MREDFVFKSKAQADKMRDTFVERYGKEEGAKKYAEIEKRSPKYEDLPDKTTTSFHHKKQRASISRRFGKHWRGA